jgi:hypothetical protein
MRPTAVLPERPIDDGSAGRHPLTPGRPDDAIDPVPIGRAVDAGGRA